MALTLIITTAGRNALVNAANTGTAPVVVSELGLSATAVVPAVGLTALAGEFKRLNALSGDVVADDTIHVIARDESTAAYSVRSIGLYLANGTLFGVYGQSAPFLTKTAETMALIPIDVKFADIAATTLTFGNANFLNPPATETVQGVAEIATQAESDAGTDDSRIVTPKKNRASFLTWVAAMFSDVWRASNDGAGSGLDADLLDGQQGSWYSNIVARLGFTPVNKAGDTMTGALNTPTLYLSSLTNFYVGSVASNPALVFALNDYISYNATTDTYIFNIGTVAQLSLDSTGYATARVGFKVSTNIVWHAGNDGAGSGMDADLLDGQQGSYYTDVVARLGYTPANRAGDTFTGAIRRDANFGMDLLSATLPGITFNGATTYFAFDRSASAFNAVIAGTNRFQVTAAGAFVSGNAVWHSANDGAGSGMDADLLDGQQGSWYGDIPARLGFTPANRAGDTFGGNVYGPFFQISDQAYWTMWNGNPLLNFDGGDGLWFDRPFNNFVFMSGSANQAIVGSDGYVWARTGFAAGGAIVWHAGNDGSGSGMDADMLDGYHASAFDRIVSASYTELNGYEIFASGKKVCWHKMAVGANSSAIWNFPISYSSWVNPQYGCSVQNGNSGQSQELGIASVNGSPPTSLTLYNSEDFVRTIWIRVEGV